MAQKVHLLIIDPQVDFCDPNGSLFVKGADQDMKRLAKFVRTYGKKFDDIHVTLDCHHLYDVAHPIFWKDSSGNHPNPFTQITKADVDSGKWTTTHPKHFPRAKQYVAELEKNKKYPLVVWPPHCLIGSPGNGVYAELYSALRDWETSELAMVNYVTKGSNPWTEHYSPLKADVLDPTDPSTQINREFIKSLEEADHLLIAGEASSHCLANCIRDLAENASPDVMRKVVLLKDATSPVTGFESLADAMISDMTKLGMRISATTEYFA